MIVENMNDDEMSYDLGDGVYELIEEFLVNETFDKMAPITDELVDL